VGVRQQGEQLQFRVNEQGEWETRNVDGEVVPME
jgi:hypothetical protein